jgi:hypothetical protein
MYRRSAKTVDHGPPSAPRCIEEQGTECTEDGWKGSEYLLCVDATPRTVNGVTRRVSIASDVISKYQEKIMKTSLA